MSMNFNAVIPRNERRVRLVLDNSPAAGAYGSSPSTLAFYSVVSTDNLGSSTTLSAAIVVAGQPNVVDLAFGNDLTLGSIYSVSVTALPCTDASTATGTLQFQLGKNFLGIANQEQQADDYAALLYGTDLAYGGTDFIETADGDLATLSGLGNAQQAVRMRLFGDGLPWDPTWGARARQYVDGTTPALPNLRAALVTQAKADDRVKTAIATLTTGGPTDPYSAYFAVQVVLIGGEILAPIDIQMPNQ